MAADLGLKLFSGLRCEALGPKTFSSLRFHGFWSRAEVYRERPCGKLGLNSNNHAAAPAGSTLVPDLTPRGRRHKLQIRCLGFGGLWRFRAL